MVLKKYPHLASGLLVIVLVLVGVGITDLSAQWVESNYVHALAPVLFDQKGQGLVLQKLALEQTDLLMLYAASELSLPDYSGPYRPSALFQNYPTGFTVFNVNFIGVTSLVYAENLAAIGPDLEGKKVVLFISPDWFFHSYDDPRAREAYLHTFSRLHAHEVVYSLTLSYGLKRELAKEMRRYPKSIKGDPLLRFAVEELANGTPPSQILYYLSLPLGLVHNWVLRLQDHQATIDFVRAHPAIKAPVRQEASLDWAKLRAAGEQESIQMSDNNPVGYDKRTWENYPFRPMEPQDTFESPEAFTAAVARSTEWGDVDLMLRVIKELGAVPIIFALPIKGPYLDTMGIPASARQIYYEKLDAVAGRWDVPLYDFADHDEDKYFLTDRASHPSPLAWIYFDQVLDGFYHASPIAIRP